MVDATGCASGAGGTIGRWGSTRATVHFSGRLQESRAGGRRGGAAAGTGRERVSPCRPRASLAIGNTRRPPRPLSATASCLPCARRSSAVPRSRREDGFLSVTCAPPEGCVCVPCVPRTDGRTDGSSHGLPPGLPVSVSGQTIFSRRQIMTWSMRLRRLDREASVPSPALGAVFRTQ